MLTDATDKASLVLTRVWSRSTSCLGFTLDSFGSFDSFDSPVNAIWTVPVWVYKSYGGW